MAKFNNQLTDAELERLALLSEELGEVQQCIGKIIRHGYESHDPTQISETNRVDLSVEIGHVDAAVKMMVLAGDLHAGTIGTSTERKTESVKKWLHHQASA